MMANPTPWSVLDTSVYTFWWFRYLLHSCWKLSLCSVLLTRSLGYFVSHSIFWSRLWCFIVHRLLTLSLRCFLVSSRCFSTEAKGDRKDVKNDETHRWFVGVSHVVRLSPGPFQAFWNVSRVFSHARLSSGFMCHRCGYLRAKLFSKDTLYRCSMTLAYL